MKKSNLLIPALLLTIGFIVVALVFSNTFKYKYKQQNIVTVTGNALKNFESDIVKWKASYSRKSRDLAEASAMLEQDRKKVEEFLTSYDISKDEIVFQSVNIQKDYTYQTNHEGVSTSIFTGYSLSQTVVVTSNHLDNIGKVAREISSLLSLGIELTSQAPQFYYSDLESLKLDLIKEASSNAYQRAENIAQESQAKINQLQQADLGIFQITGLHEDEEYSFGGAFNTSSRSKTAQITVKAKYLLK